MEQIAEMSDKKNTIIILLAAIGGFFVLKKLFDFANRDKYICPKCGSTIHYHDKKCKGCNEELNWKC